MVTPTPKAIDSPAEPAVCTMLFSRMVARRRPNACERPRNSVMASTATGIDADTVMPTLSTRYSDEAAKIRPSDVPRTTADKVNSGICDIVGDVGLVARRFITRRGRTGFCGGGHYDGSGASGAGRLHLSRNRAIVQGRIVCGVGAFYPDVPPGQLFASFSPAGVPDICTVWRSAAGEGQGSGGRSVRASWPSKRVASAWAAACRT